MLKLVNFPKVTNFRFYCSELPLTSELIQDVTVPTITVGGAQVSNQYVDYNEPGEKMLYTELDLGFIMDENYDAYAEIYSWMTRMVGVPGIHLPEADRKLVFADAEIILLDNAQKEVRRFIFHDAWPTTIGALPYDATGTADDVVAILTMEYTAMSIKPNTKNITQLGDFKYSH
jgi:hypothetical protein